MSDESYKPDNWAREYVDNIETIKREIDKHENGEQDPDTTDAICKLLLMYKDQNDDLKQSLIEAVKELEESSQAHWQCFDKFCGLNNKDGAKYADIKFRGTQAYITKLKSKHKFLGEK